MDRLSQEGSADYTLVAAGTGAGLNAPIVCAAAS
jgi:hypothetical protein